jgi:hypothetical protein
MALLGVAKGELRLSSTAQGLSCDRLCSRPLLGYFFLARQEAVPRRSTAKLGVNFSTIN